MQQLADSLGPFSGMSIEQNRKQGRGQGPDGGGRRRQQQQHRKMRLLLLQQDHQAQKGKEIGSKHRYECSGAGGVETKNKNKKDGMVLRIRDNNKTAADSVHLQHMTRRRKRIIPETLQNYHLPRREVAFSSDRMVPTGPNPLHNYSNISSEVIIP